MHEHSSILVVVVNSTAYLYLLHTLVVDALVVVRELYYELNLYCDGAHSIAQGPTAGPLCENGGNDPLLPCDLGEVML